VDLLSRAESTVLSQSSIFEQNPKIWSQKFNDLQTPKLSKKQLCDRTVSLWLQRLGESHGQIRYARCG
jgi:hypothetical protein